MHQNRTANRQQDNTYDWQDLQEIIHALRAPDGCPWDRVQTHESLRPCVMEEAAEVVAAVRVLKETGDPENLCEELGDLLLQVLLHSEIAKEEGEFTLEEVLTMLGSKLIRRHPHVFGDAQAENATQAYANWEQIKKQEKEGKTWVKTPLRDIPIELPALTRAQKAQKKAEKLYEETVSAEESIARMEQSLAQMKQKFAEKNGEVDEEAITELFWENANLARKLHIHAEQALNDKIDEFIARYE